MCLGISFRSAKTTIASVRSRFSSLTVSRIGVIFIILVVLLTGVVGCAKKGQQEKSTPTSGSLAVLVSPAVLSVIQAGADQFNQLYQAANVNVYPLNSRAIVDSMVNGKAEVGYFDRSLSEAESLAVVKTRKHLYSFLLGSSVATWVVHPDNPATVIDSTQAVEILTGQMTSWKALGGSDNKIDLYLPPLGDGAWMALVNFFGEALTKVDAHYWASDSLVLERVSEDPAGLGFVGTPLHEAKVKKLRWRHPLLADPVLANIGTLQEGRYPFKMRLYYYTIADRTDLASGFLSFMASNQGQRVIADQGYLPEMIPVRVVTLSPSGEQK